MAIRRASREHTRLGHLNDLVQIYAMGRDEIRIVCFPKLVVIRTFDFLKRSYVVILGLSNKGVELDVRRHDRVCGYCFEEGCRRTWGILYTPAKNQLLSAAPMTSKHDYNIFTFAVTSECRSAWLRAAKGHLKPRSGLQNADAKPIESLQISGVRPSHAHVFDRVSRDLTPHV